MSRPASVIVAGVGNTLMQDDGIGVWAVRAIDVDFAVPPALRLLEAGVLGMQLVHELRSAEQLLIIDAMNGGGPPGTIYRLDATALSNRRRTLMSLHEVGLADVLSVAALLGWRPRTRILGVQPLEVRTPGLELTPTLRAALPQVTAAAVEELRGMGVPVAKRPRSASLEQTFA